MTEQEKQIQNLITQLFNNKLSDFEQNRIHYKISELSPDPYWSDLIFWSNGYLDDKCQLNFEKFFQKINQYPTSEHGIKRARIKILLSDLLDSYFQNMDEMSLVKELNELIGNYEWIDSVLVTKKYRNKNGSFNFEDFLNQTLPSPHPIQNFY